jgi:UDP-GlcNAc:undecaprenyl-phosphate GlcNAc-1-phosphate transferase
MFFKYIIPFIISLAVTGISVPLVIYLSRSFNLYDKVNDRKIHETTVSRLGGLSIFLGFLIPFFIYIYSAKYIRFNIDLYLLAVLIIFSTGFIDDVGHIRARYKLVLQIVAATLVTLSGLTISNLMFFDLFEIKFGFLSYFITIIWIILFVNAINLLDGMDGLAAGIVFIANIFVFILANTLGNTLVCVISLIMAGAILGFYIYNFPPAKIFMGDGGAYFLGFMYATLPLMGIKKSSVATLFLIPLILLLLPLLDTFQVIFKRWRMGYNIFIADKNHIHHRLLNIGLSIRGILFILYMYTIILGLTSILMLHIKPGYSLVLFLIVSLLVLLSFYLLNSAEKIIEESEKRD